ncbi:MAG: hypothetical protein V3T05_14080 [Myxococcota bacterium]
MLTTTLIVALSLAKPFDDPQERFRINLPKCWTVIPQGAGASSTTFTCQKGKKLGNAAVQVFAVEPGTAVSTVIVRLTQSIETQPGYKLFDQSSARLGGKKAARRRYQIYINGDPTLAKVSEDRAIVENGTAYVVHVEAIASAYSAFTKDFNTLFRTLKPLKGVGVIPGAQAGTAKNLVGTWLMVGAGDTVLELRVDGTFDLAGVSGIFGQEGSKLIMRPNGGGPEQYTWAVAGNELVLTSPTLGEPIRYRRK